jgi:hypothetical protein
MNSQNRLSIRLVALATAILFSVGLTTANADEPCPFSEDFGECKVLIEINSTDGDIGFHFLVDGDNLIHTVLFNEKHKKIFSYIARRELREQFVTETFVESAEPFCRESLKEEEDDDVVTLLEFLDRWSAGDYHFFGIGEGWEFSHGVTVLTKEIPAAPILVAFDDMTGVISWADGDDLGECATFAELAVLVGNGDLPVHPDVVAIDAWEVVFEPDVDDGDPLGALVFSIRVPVGQLSVTVPPDYLASLPNDTLAKVEVGAIGGGDNATFTEIFDICVNEDEGCEDD